MSFKKIQISAQNIKVLAFGFNEKHYFTGKNDRNSIFFYYEAHIPYRLYILVLCINFDKFFQKSYFGSKSIGASIRFERKNASLR
jgi:hypothetical protein